MSAHLTSSYAQDAEVKISLVCTLCSLISYIVTLLVWTVLDCIAVPWCAAGGTYSLVGGQWLDATRPSVCQQCPSAEASIVVCNDNKV